MNSEIMENSLNQATEKPRNRFVVFLLSIISPGLGYMYNGQLKKCIILSVVYTIVVSYLMIVHLSESYYGLLVFMLFHLVFYLFTIIDNVIKARRQMHYHLKSFNRWYYYLLVISVVITVNLLFNKETINDFKTFKNESSAQLPTMEVGDQVFADMKYYHTEKLDYGHIALFESPDGETWTFRVVGLPNDKLEVKDNSVVINGIPSKSLFIGETKIDEKKVFEFEEELPNGHKHRIYKHENPIDVLAKNIESIVVPADSYYLMGDNRDNANDSRFIGAIHKSKILGRVIYSYWGQSFDRINIDFTKN